MIFIVFFFNFQFFFGDHKRQFYDEVKYPFQVGDEKSIHYLKRSTYYIHTRIMKSQVSITTNNPLDEV